MNGSYGNQCRYSHFDDEKNLSSVNSDIDNHETHVSRHKKSTSLSSSAKGSSVVSSVCTFEKAM